VPSLYASGEHRWGGAITKQGSTLLRWALGAGRSPGSAPRPLQPLLPAATGEAGTRQGDGGPGKETGGDQLLPLARGGEPAVRAIETVRERTWGGAWSEDRPRMCD